jgi:hypothetical protein
MSLVPFKDFVRLFLAVLIGTNYHTGMEHKKGDVVTVTDYRGKTVRRRVWKDDGERVWVTSDEVFKDLENGQSELWPIPFPKDSVSMFLD